MTREHKIIVAWDFDGTLAFRNGGFSGALLTCALRAFPDLPPITIEQVRPFLTSGFPWHAPEILHIDQTADDWWENLTPVFARALKNAGLSAPAALQAAAQMREEYLNPDAWSTYEDTLPALRAVQAMGYEQVLLSNHVPELPQIVDRLGLSFFFNARFNSGETGIEKPNQKAFQQVISWVGSFSHPVMVGDNFSSDIIGAQESGMIGILVRKYHQDARLYCETLSDLPAVMKNLENLY